MFATTAQLFTASVRVRSKFTSDTNREPPLFLFFGALSFGHFQGIIQVGHLPGQHKRRTVRVIVLAGSLLCSIDLVWILLHATGA